VKFSTCKKVKNRQLSRLRLHTRSVIFTQNRQVTDYEIRYFAQALKVSEGDFFINSEQK
jgi:hypothetical protein